jgi:hypothetical protein
VTTTPPLELVLRLDHDTILPTCNLDDAHILQHKTLPLTRSNQFLNTITSFACSGARDKVGLHSSVSECILSLGVV